MSENSMQIFENKQFGKVRVVKIDECLWMVAKDIAEALGYANTADAIGKHVDDEDKLTSQIAIAGQNRNVILINESGLYSLVMSSKLPDAKKFKKWVTSEILPSIRKTGAYSAKPMSAMEMLALQVQVNRELSERIEKVEETQSLILEACSVPSIGRDEWQTRVKKYVSDMCATNKLDYKETYDELYRILEDKTGCNLASRQRNMRKRLKKAGATVKERDGVSKLMVISKDQTLATAFEGIVQRKATEFAAKTLSEKAVQ